MDLAREKNIDSVEVRWPSGINQVLYDIRADQNVEIVEKVEAN